MAINVSITDAHTAPIPMTLPSNHLAAHTLNPDQVKLLLSIFRGHSVNHSGMFLPFLEMYKLDSMFSSDKNMSFKQKLRECCFAGNTSMHQLICTPVELLGPPRALLKLPGSLEAFIERLTEEQAKNLLTHLIDSKSGSLKVQNLGEVPTPGNIFLKAIQTQNLLLVQFLCSAGFACSALSGGLQETGPQNQTALMYAAQQGNTQILDSLLQAAGYYQLTAKFLQDSDEMGQKAILYAASGGHAEVVKALLRAADSDQARVELLESRCHAGNTLFMNAAYGGNVEVLQIIVDAKEATSRASLFTNRNTLGQIPLTVAGSAEAVTFLLDQGEALGGGTKAWFLAAVDHNGERPLDYLMRVMLCAHRRPKEAIRALILAGANPAAVSVHNTTALMRGASYGNLHAVEALLESVTSETRAALLTARDSNGHTAFMHAALGRGNPEVLRFLFNADSEARRLNILLEQDNIERTALMLPRTPQHMLMLLTLAREVNQCNKLINMRDQNGDTALFWAIWRGQRERPQQGIGRYTQNESVEQIALLIDAGLHATDKNSQGLTALMYAVAQGNSSLVRAWLETMDPEARIALFQIKDLRGCTTWSYVHSTDLEMLRVLFEMDHAEARSAFFMYTVRAGSQGLPTVRAMLEIAESQETKNSFLHFRDTEGKTPFMQAASCKNNAEVLRILFNAVSPDHRRSLLLEKNKKGRTALMFARTAEDTHTLLAMAKEVGCEKQLLHSLDVNDETALHWALWRGRKEKTDAGYDENETCAQILGFLDAGLSLSDQNRKGTVLMYAIEQGNVNIVRMLAETRHSDMQQALLTTRNLIGHSVFMEAVSRNSPPEMLDVLFDATHPEMQLNYLLETNKEGQTPLMLAKSMESTKWLLSRARKLNCAKELVNARTLKGETAFMQAACGNHLETLQALFEAIPQESQISMLLHKDHTGQTALMWAKSAEHMRLILEMAERSSCKNALINVCNASNETALFSTIRRAYRSANRIDEQEGLAQICILLEAGSSLEDQGPDQATPLIYAVALGTAQVVQLLLKFVNADARSRLLEAKNSQGETAFMLAVKKGNADMLRFLFEGAPSASQVALLLAKNNEGLTPLMCVKTLEMLPLILEMAKKVGCSRELIQACDLADNTAFDLIALETNIYYKMDQFEKMRILFDFGKNAVTQKLNTLSVFIHLAVESNNLYIINKLIKSLIPEARRALLNAKDSKGRTPLMHAVAHGAHVNILKMLSDHV